MRISRKLFYRDNARVPTGTAHQTIRLLKLRHMKPQSRKCMADRDGGNIKGNYLYPSQLLSGGEGGHLLNTQSTIRTFALVIIYHNWFGRVV